MGQACCSCALWQAWILSQRSSGTAGDIRGTISSLEGDNVLEKLRRKDGKWQKWMVVPSFVRGTK